jgi:hypothetical protein
VSDCAQILFQPLKEHINKLEIKRPNPCTFLPGGSSLTAFHKGKDSIPETIYTAVYSKIISYNLGADLLVVGFDDEAHIFSISNPGIHAIHTPLNFWAVGTGAPAALSSLFIRNYSVLMSIEQALFYVYEAKVQAERATNVGENTDICVIAKGEIPEPISDQDKDNILNNVWLDVKPKDLSRDHIHEIRKIGEVKRMLKRFPSIAD